MPSHWFVYACTTHTHMRAHMLANAHTSISYVSTLSTLHARVAPPLLLSASYPHACLCCPLTGSSAFRPPLLTLLKPMSGCFTLPTILAPMSCPTVSSESSLPGEISRRTSYFHDLRPVCLLLGFSLPIWTISKTLPFVAEQRWASVRV